MIGLKIVGEGLLEPPAEGVTMVERSSLEYSRGDLGKFDGFISDNKGGLNYAEYDVELPEAGEYLVLLKYAALAARVASMKLNGKVVGGGIMTRTTGSWNVNTARWFNEGLVKFPRGKSVLRLEKNGVFSHLTTIRIARPTPKSKEPAKTVRASAGSLFQVGTVRASAVDAIAAFAGANVPLWVAEADGQNVEEAEATDTFALVLGNEGAGPRVALRDASTHSVAVPMSGSLNSLNVAVAGSILLYELTKESRS